MTWTPFPSARISVWDGASIWLVNMTKPSNSCETLLIWTPALFFHTSFLGRRTNRKKRLTRRLQSFGAPQTFQRAVHPSSPPWHEPTQYRGERRKRESYWIN